MAASTFDQQTKAEKFQAHLRRFLRWISRPQVILSLIMLVVMFYMVIIPLYRMVVTTITVSDSDLRVLKDANIGDITWYHWVRMLTSKIAVIMTYEPLLHSLTISLGATVLALAIGGLMAWLVVSRDNCLEYLIAKVFSDFFGLFRHLIIRQPLLKDTTPGMSDV